MSRLFKFLSMLETQTDRKFAMQERRREFVEPTLVDYIKIENNQEHLIMELGVELGDIYDKMFQAKYDEIKAMN